MSVKDNVKTALHNQVKYGLAESILHLGSYKAKEKEMDEKAMDILKVFELDSYADTFASVSYTHLQDLSKQCGADARSARMP